MRRKTKIEASLWIFDLLFTIRHEAVLHNSRKSCTYNLLSSLDTGPIQQFTKTWPAFYIKLLWQKCCATVAFVYVLPTSAQFVANFIFNIRALLDIFGYTFRDVVFFILLDIQCRIKLFDIRYIKLTFREIMSPL